MKNHKEVSLAAHQALQAPRKDGRGSVLRRMLKGIATHNYDACAETVPEAFGLSSSSVCRRYIKGTARKLAEFQERSLDTTWWPCLSTARRSRTRKSSSPWGALSTAPRSLWVFVQAATENERVCRSFPAGLVERGLHYEESNPSQDGGGLRKRTHEEAKSALTSDAGPTHPSVTAG